MKTKKWIFSFLCLLITVSCQNKKTEKALTSLDLLRGEITLCDADQFGDVNFSQSCDVNIRETFNLAVSLLHSFEYEEAEKTFVKVIDNDSACAMAYWGIAMSNFHELWLQSGTYYLEKGEKVLAAAQPLQKSAREQAYLDALGAFYNNWKTISHTVRVFNFERKMEAVYKKYADDKEAAIFYALALTASADPTDKTYKNQLKSGALLEAIYSTQPNHPGIAHYIIHNYDYPELARLALPVARRYAQIAPASAHAQHMPSHIFTRLGLWDESIASNINSIASAQCYAESIDPEEGHWDEELHGMDYLVYAYLQTGENDKAKEQYEYLKTFKKVFPVNFKIAYAINAIPARIALENKNWSDAANLTLPDINVDWSKFPWETSILHFARGIGFIHLDNIPSAEKELATLNVAQLQLETMGDAYKANQVEVQVKTLQAWIYFIKGQTEAAISLMEEAAQTEYNMAKHPVTPGEVLPADELLGELYLATDNPEQALLAFEVDLKRHPNRLNGMYGAATAAQAIGNQQKSLLYIDSIRLQTKNSASLNKAIKASLVI